MYGKQYKGEQPDEPELRKEVQDPQRPAAGHFSAWCRNLPPEKDK